MIKIKVVFACHNSRKRKKQMTEQAFRCQNLLTQYQQVYKDFTIKEAQYHQDLDAMHSQMEQEREAEHARNERLQQFKSSPFIITSVSTQGAQNAATVVVNCGDCRTHEELEKCLCQQQYGDRPHLITNVSANVKHQLQLQQMQQLFQPTKQLCEARGHLLSETQQILALRNPQSDNNADNIDNSSANAQTIAAPKEPMLILPTITCGPCKKEFEALHEDFSYKNIVGVNACIHKLSTIPNSTSIAPKHTNYTSFRPPPPLPLSGSEPDIVDHPINGTNDTTAQNALKSKWMNVLLIGGGILLFALCGYLLYSILKNLPYDMVCTRAIVLRQAELQRIANTTNPDNMDTATATTSVGDEDDGERIDHSREEYRDEQDSQESFGSQNYQDHYGDSSLEFE